MKLQVYEGEIFERGKNWYVAFGLFVVFFIFFNLFIGNFWAIIFFLIILAGYLYVLLLEKRKIFLEINPEGLYVGGKIIPWNSLQGFVLEVLPNGMLKNIVLIKTNGGVNIYTIAEKDLEKIKEFVLNLAEYIPMLEGYNQTFFEKLLRILKL